MKVCFHTGGHLGDFLLTIPFLNLIIDKYPENEYYQYVKGMDDTRYPDSLIKTVPHLTPSETLCGDINIPSWFCDPSYQHLHKTGEEADKLLYPYDMVSIQKYYWKYVFENNNFDIEIPGNLGLEFDFENVLGEDSVKTINIATDTIQKKILFVNIKGRSGQTDNDDWLGRIDAIAKTYPEWNFYYTNEENHEIENSNVIHTPSIFGNHPSDLVHNAYLSTFCDIIVARNSGAFIAISMQNKNVLNENKTFITQTQDNTHKSDLECFYNRTIYKAENIHTRVSQETFYKLEELLWSCQ